MTTGVLRSLIFVGLCTMIVGGCSNKAVDETSTSTTTTSVAPTTTLAPASTTTTTKAQPVTTTTTPVPQIDWTFVEDDYLPVITLVDPGEEPRQILSLVYEVGSTSTVVMRNSLDLEQAIGGEVAASIATDVGSEVTTTVLLIDESGYTVKQTFGPSLAYAGDPASTAALQALYADLEGRSTYSLLSTNGKLVATETSELPPELGDLTQGLAGASLPLPEVPIGIGAVWEITATVSSAGTDFIQTSTVTLISVDGPTITIEVDVLQTLGPDGFVFPGVDAEDLEYTTVGIGTAEWDLTTPGPSQATSTVDQSLNATLIIGDQETTLEQVMVASIEVGPDVGFPTVPGADEYGNPEILGDPLPDMPRDQALETPDTDWVHPTVLGEDFDGNAVEVRNDDGRAKAIVFLAHWCPHCQAEVPRVQAWIDDTGGLEGVDIYSVATSTSPDRGNFPPSEWLDREGWTSPVIKDDLDNSVHASFGGGGFPFWVFINADGTVALRVSGELQIEMLESILDSLDN